VGSHWAASRFWVEIPANLFGSNSLCLIEYKVGLRLTNLKILAQLFKNIFTAKYLTVLKYVKHFSNTEEEISPW